MMETEMDNHLGYEKSERSGNDDYRNGHNSKRSNSSYVSIDIQAPQDRYLPLILRLSRNAKWIYQITATCMPKVDH